MLDAGRLNRPKRIVRKGKAILGYYTDSELWYMLINEYCRRDITFEEDKFPAISAAAKECQCHSGFEYKAGLWCEDIHLSLIQSVWGPGAKKPSAYIAPSWSWGSLNFEAIQKENNIGSYLDTYDTYEIYKYEIFGRGSSQTLFADVLKVNVENVEQNPFSRVRNATLWVRGPCLNICRCNVPIPFFDCHEYNTDNDQYITRLTRGGYTSATRAQFANDDHGKCWRWDTIQELG